MTGSINVALIGTKFMGRAHSNAWLNVPRFFEVDPLPVMHTVVGRNAADLDAFAARWGWLRATVDWKAAVTAPEVGLVDVATPNDVHAEQSIAALEAGKHVACEKPLAGTLADAEAMASAAAKAPGARRSSGTTTAACRPSPSPTSSHGRGARADLPRARRLPPELGRTRHPAALAVPGRKSPARAHTATSTPTSSTSPASSPARRSSTSTAPSSTPSSRSGPCSRPAAAVRSPVPAPRPPRRTGPSTVDDAVLFLGPPQRRRARQLRGQPPRHRLPQRQRLRDPRRARGAALRLRADERARVTTTPPPTVAVQGWTTIDVTRGGDGTPTPRPGGPTATASATSTGS